MSAVPRLAECHARLYDISPDLVNVLLLPFDQLEKLAYGPVKDGGEYDCNVCNVLKDPEYPERPSDHNRIPGYLLVLWHNQSSSGMYERCLCIYLAAAWVIDIRRQYADPPKEHPLSLSPLSPLPTCTWPG